MAGSEDEDLESLDVEKGFRSAPGNRLFAEVDCFANI